MIPLYAIGDIHGMILQLGEALSWIKEDSGDNHFQVVFLGDYCDRGPNTNAVFETLIALRDRKYWGSDVQYDAMFLRGNHEQMMVDALSNPSQANMWLLNGGIHTLDSYPDSIVNPSHVDFIKNNTDIMVETDHLVFVHAGLPENDLSTIVEDLDDPNRATVTENTLMWTRDRFLNSNFNWGKRVVHGHTITKAPVIRSNRIGLDIGCFYSGNLAIGKWEEDKTVDPIIKIIEGKPAVQYQH